MKIWGYSERGMINAIFYEMAISANRNNGAMRKFLSFIKKIDNTSLFDDKSIKNVEIIIEPSLSGFGSPDVLIFFENKTKNVIFLEAKVKTWHRKTEWTDEDIIKKEVIDQLRLKQELFNNKEVVKETNEYNNKKLGSNLIVKKVFDKIYETKNAFYVALLPIETDSKNNIFAKSLSPNASEGVINDTWGLLTWKAIRENKLSKALKNLENNFIKNQSGNNSQIYFTEIKIKENNKKHK